MQKMLELQRSSSRWTRESLAVRVFLTSTRVRVTVVKDLLGCR